ncbi:hypothetical protein [Fodinicola feengrottensis]|uniref:hypothetical protein n=1 Tax=Fodinicola feengrottensis TaxID=435914 RepID=UPI0013D4F9FF|nr:hypothetical protein [Fodinicola feengrottensis]
MIEVAKIHARDHQPLLPPAAASVIPVCRAWHCNESWPCPVRRNAVTVLWFYGINPASVDDPPRQPLPDTGPARRPRPHLPTATQDSLCPAAGSQGTTTTAASVPNGVGREHAPSRVLCRG